VSNFPGDSQSTYLNVGFYWKEKLRARLRHVTPQRTGRIVYHQLRVDGESEVRFLLIHFRGVFQFWMMSIEAPFHPEQGIPKTRGNTLGSFSGLMNTQGHLELELDPQDQSSAFETSLANIAAIEPNRWFATIADLARYVAENRRRESGI